MSKSLQILTKDDSEILECTQRRTPSYKEGVAIELYVGRGRQEAWINLDLGNTVKLAKWLIERIREIGEE